MEQLDLPEPEASLWMSTRDVLTRLGPQLRPLRVAAPDLERGTIAVWSEDMSKTITAERDLMKRLRTASRRALGPVASDADVETRARRAYEGPSEPKIVLTPEEERAWRQQLAENMAEAERAGVMDL